MKWLKQKWPYILALSLCSTFCSSLLIGLDIVLSHPSDFPILEETCEIGNSTMQYKDVLIILLCSLVSCCFLNLFSALFSYFFKKVCEVKKDENNKTNVK